MTKQPFNSAPEKKKFDWMIRHKVILPPDTEGDLSNYKEPLTTAPSGHGFMGTLKYNKDKTHVQCHICGWFFKSLGQHTVKTHHLTADMYRVGFELDSGTSLAAPKLREKFVKASMARSPEHKRKILTNLQKGRVGRKHYPRNHSLEYFNKRGNCPDQLVEKIKNLNAEFKKVPTRREYITKYGEGNLQAVYRVFGTWNNALTICGFTPNQFRASNPTYTRDGIIEAMREFYDLEGRPPRTSDSEDPSSMIPRMKVIAKHFGGIINAREAAFGEYDYVNEN